MATREAAQRIRLGVLISGTGSNLSAILEARAAERLPHADVALVISNKAEAAGLDRAAEHGVPTKVIPHRGFASREAFDAALVAALREAEVDWVVLAGFMRVVTSVLLDAFPSRVVNIHPSLLPAFPGVDAQGQAFRYGVKVAGCTVHLVDGGVDTGPIIAQAAVDVSGAIDEGAVRSAILEQEHRLLPEVLAWIAAGRVHVHPAKEGERARVIVESSPC